MQTCTHLCHNTAIIVDISRDILFTICGTITQCYLCQQSQCIILIFGYTILFGIGILLLNCLLCQNYIAVLIILIFRNGVIYRSERRVNLGRFVQITVFVFCNISKCIGLTGKLTVLVISACTLGFIISSFVNSMTFNIN